MAPTGGKGRSTTSSKSQTAPASLDSTRPTRKRRKHLRNSRDSSTDSDHAPQPQQWLLPHVLSMQLPRLTSWIRELSLMPVASSLMLNEMQSHQDHVCHPFLCLFPLCLHLPIPLQTQSPEHNPTALVGPRSLCLPSCLPHIHCPDTNHSYFCPVRHVIHFPTPSYGSIKTPKTTENNRKLPKTTENYRKQPKTLQQLYRKQPKTTENNQKHHSNCTENNKKVQKTLQ